MSATNSSMHQHRRSFHEGIKYPCGQCDYLSVTNSSMHLHRRSVHERTKYPCEQCEYHATSNSNLKQFSSIHEGMKQAGAELGQTQHSLG